MRQPLSSVRSIVIKLGTQVLSDSSRRLDEQYLCVIADQAHTLKERGIAVTIVSSGAIGAGLAILNMAKRPKDLPSLQAVAAVGQRRLMDAWADAFAPHKTPVAQVLLTREDIDSRQRFLNLRNTITATHKLGAIPIINENDTISTDELVRITFGDNDILAALVATALRADVLALLSVVDGINSADGQPIRTIDRSDEARSHVRSEKSAMGKGGMNSKIEAARMVTRHGITMFVAHGRDPNILPRLLDGDERGTIFIPSKTNRARIRNRWIDAARPSGTITIDEGATRALVDRNKSLLPAGVCGVEGKFEPGDVVQILSLEGTPIARGLTNYSASDLEYIRGRKSAEVRSLLGPRAYDEAVHRDNLIVIV